MSIAYVQIAAAADGTGSVVKTINATFGSNNTLGNRLVLHVCWTNDASATTDTVAVTDTAGNTWDQIGSTTHEAVGGWGTTYCAFFEVPSCKAASSNKVTITITSPSNACIFPGFGCVEYSGSNSSAPSYSFTVNFTTSCEFDPTTEATITPLKAGDVLVGWGTVFNSFGNGGAIVGNTQRPSSTTFYGTHCGGNMYCWSELVAPSTAPATVGCHQTGGGCNSWAYQAVAIPVAPAAISVPFWAAP